MTSPELEHLNFEQALAELERIVRLLEDGQTGLEESLASYEQGVALLKRCYTQISQAEQRILLLTGVNEEGQPVTEPFDHAPTKKESGNRGQRSGKRKLEAPEGGLEEGDKSSDPAKRRTDQSENLF